MLAVWAHEERGRTSLLQGTEAGSLLIEVISSSRLSFGHSDAIDILTLSPEAFYQFAQGMSNQRQPAIEQNRVPEGANVSFPYYCDMKIIVVVNVWVPSKVQMLPISPCLHCKYYLMLPIFCPIVPQDNSDRRVFIVIFIKYHA